MSLVYTLCSLSILFPSFLQSAPIVSTVNLFYYLFRIRRYSFNTSIFFYSFRRYFGVEIGHLQMAIYTARREEMVNVVRATLFYMNPDEPVPVHSLSALSSPYQVFLIFWYYFAVILFCYVFKVWLRDFIWISSSMC